MTSHVVVWRHECEPLRNRRDRSGLDLAPYKIVFAPVAYVMSETQASRIRSFVQGGGMFVTNFRLGVKTETSQIVRTPLPGLLRDVMGVTVEDYVPMYSAKKGVKFSPLWQGRTRSADSGQTFSSPRERKFLAPYQWRTCGTSGRHHEQLWQRKGRVHRRRPGCRERLARVLDPSQRWRASSGPLTSPRVSS